MKIVMTSVFLGALVIFGPVTWAYDVNTHRSIAEAAANGSLLRMETDVLRNMGLRLPIDDDRQTILNSDGKLRNIQNLINDGSEFEDSLLTLRPIHHFFDPTNDGGWTQCKETT